MRKIKKNRKQLLKTVDYTVTTVCSLITSPDMGYILTNNIKRKFSTVRFI